VFNGDEYSFQAGAGIVADSVPETEYEEVLAKSGSMVRDSSSPRRDYETSSAADRHYDSFTYNLVQAFSCWVRRQVFRNDAITPDAARELSPSHCAFLPGPAPVRRRSIHGHDPRLCGRSRCSACVWVTSHREVFGGKVVRAGRLMHGKTSTVEHDGRWLFAGLPQSCELAAIIR